MSKYNEKYDYVSAHLQWIRDRPKFSSRAHSQLPLIMYGRFNIEKQSYIDTMTEWYTTSTSPYINKIAYINYQDDLRWQEECKLINDSFKLNEFQTNVFFVTIGFNHQEFTCIKAFEYIQSALNSTKILDGSFAVLENYRSNGEHPHVHMKLYVSGSIPKSVLIQTLFRCKHSKKLILSKNFIDVKVFESYHDSYLDGDKQDDKLQLVDKDRDWRDKNKIPHKLFKDTKL